MCFCGVFLKVFPETDGNGEAAEVARAAEGFGEPGKGIPALHTQRQVLLLPEPDIHPGADKTAHRERQLREVLQGEANPHAGAAGAAAEAGIDADTSRAISIS